MNMESGGRHEVEAARKRLAAARAQNTTASNNMQSAEEMLDDANTMMESATNMLQSAKAMMQKATHTVANATRNKIAARSQVESSKKEVEDAEKSLKEAEKRWEVIDISDNEEESNRKKRRKSSTARTQESSANVVGDNGSGRIREESSANNRTSSTNFSPITASLAEAMGVPPRSTRGSGSNPENSSADDRDRTSSINSAAATSTNRSASSSSIAQRATSRRRSEYCRSSSSPAGIIQDAATREMSSTNRAFQPVSTTGSSNTAKNVHQILVEGCGIPEVNGTYTRTGPKRYSKKGHWNGAPTKFKIVSTSYNKMWFIASSGDSNYEMLYTTKRRQGGYPELPPKSSDDWWIGEYNPPPQLKWL